MDAAVVLVLAVPEVVVAQQAQLAVPAVVVAQQAQLAVPAVVVAQQAQTTMIKTKAICKVCSRQFKY